MVKQVWQAWNDGDGGILFAPALRCAELKRQGLLSADAVLLHELVAATGEQAMALHHEKMGFEPYQPTGESQTCPNHCGDEYYPEGYGDCPNCGHLG